MAAAICGWVECAATTRASRKGARRRPSLIGIRERWPGTIRLRATNNMKTRGFTLIELMIVIAIIGVLAAIAIPTYRDFIVRSKVTEGLVALSPYKVRLAEYVLDNADVPPSDEDYMTGGTGMVSKVKWSVHRNAIEVWFGTAAGTELSGKILWLQPTVQTQGGIIWLCRGHDGDGGESWAMPQRYLPSSCRD